MSKEGATCNSGLWIKRPEDTNSTTPQITQAYYDTFWLNPKSIKKVKAE